MPSPAKPTSQLAVVLGTESSNPDSTQPSFWSSVINSIRNFFASIFTTPKTSNLTPAQNPTPAQNLTTDNLPLTTDSPTPNTSNQTPAQNLTTDNLPLTTDSPTPSPETDTARRTTDNKQLTPSPTPSPTRIIERIVERVVPSPAPSVAGISESAIDEKFMQLSNALRAEIYRVEANASRQGNSNFSAIALTQRIDNLANVTVSNATITNSTFAGSVTGTSGSFSGALSGTTGSFSGLLTGTDGIFSGNLTATNATTTSSFSTTASSTNLSTGNFSLGSISGFLKATAGVVTNALINLATDITGILGIANGGTNNTSFSTDSLTYFDGTKLTSTSSPMVGYITATSTTATSTFAGGLTAGTNGLTVLQSGNVGVGTASPGAKLEVNGIIQSYNSSDNAMVRAKSSNGAMSMATLGWSEANFAYVQGGEWGGTTRDLALQGGGGNVGIGTTAPSRLLNIKGNDATAGTSLLRLDNSGTLSNESALEFFTSSTIDAGSFRAGRIYGKFDDATYISSRLTLQSLGSGNTLIDTLTLKNGNVGIGTTTPASKLQVVNNADSSTHLIIENPNAGTSARSGLIVSNTAGSETTQGFFGVGGTGYTGVSSWQDSLVVNAGADLSGGLKIRSTVGGIGLYADGSTSAPNMFINTSGNVGIGTTSPAAKLHIAGSANAFTTAAAIELEDTAGNAASRNWTIGNALYNWGALDFSVGASLGATPVLSGVKMSILQSGNVGIGTTTPWGTLSVRRTSGATDAIGRFQAAVGSYTGTSLIAENTLGAASTFNLFEAATDADGDAGGRTVQFVIRGDGNVGIGTTNPSAQKLVVAGNIRVGTGTTGCVEDADGTLLAGTCSSDERLKKNIIPFVPVLDRLVSLTPVTYNWRADEFPDRHLGNSLQTGLIAQEVETQFPELVMTDDKGFKQIVFQYLPFYMLQGIKELAVKVEAVIAKVAGFADVFTTKKLCLEDVCVTKTELQALLASASVANSTASDLTPNTSNLTPASITIQIQGNNPATINVGDVYGDLGAIITAPLSAQNFGIKASLDGGALGEISQIVVDTSIAGIHSIIYSVFDQTATTTAERILNVVSLVVPPIATSTPDTATSTTPLI